MWRLDEHVESQLNRARKLYTRRPTSTRKRILEVLELRLVLLIAEAGFAVPARLDRVGTCGTHLLKLQMSRLVGRHHGSNKPQTNIIVPVLERTR